MAGKLFNIYSGNTGGVLSTSTAKVGSFGTTSDDFYSVNFDTGRKSIWTNNIEFGRAADWGNISGIPSWISSDGVTWADVKDKPATATRWPYWSEILSKPAAIGSATQPVYWDGSTFQLVNSVAPASHDHDTRYVKLDGTNVMSGDLTLNLGNLDRFIVFSYPNTVNPTSNSWRTGVLGTGSGENNFFVVQYQKINTNSSDWNTAFKIGQDTGTVTFTNNIKVGSYTVYHSGNLPAYPTVNNGALNLQASGTTKVTFYANQAGTSNFNIATGSANGTISVGGTDVAVKGLGSNAYSSTAYLPLAGGTMNDDAQIKRKGKGGSWISGRDNALIKETSSSGYHPLFSLKTKDGSWELGEYNTSGWYNIPVFSYITDENYNNGNNSATYQIKYPLASGTIALTADLTWSKIADKPATATRWPSWDEVTSKPSVFPVADHNHDSRYPRKFSYTLPSQKGVRISYSSDASVLVSVCGSNSGAQLVIIGTGYGEGGRTRNQFTELVSCNLFDWSIPNSDSIYHSVEIFSRRNNNSTVWVISTGDITFTEINALTSPKENATLLNSSNYTDYTVKKDGTGATGTWGINISGNAATATKLKTARTITINGSSKTFDGTGNISWSLADLNLPSNEHNHDDRYLKLSGGTMTGAIKRHYAAASDDPFYSVTSNNLDIWVWRVMHNASAASVSTSASYGFGLKYLGSGSENNNDLALYSDNQSGPQVEAIRIKQSGAVTFSKQISSTLVTGTPPFNVTSTTLNTNLNADLLDGIHANGLFTNFSNKTVSGNKVLAATIGGKELTVAVEYAGSANTANTATNLTNKPSLQAGTTDTNKITVTAGEKTSNEFTVPFATNSDTLDGKHANSFVEKIKSTGPVVFIQSSVYQWDGVLITTPFTWSNPNTPGMFAFTIRSYIGYEYSDIVISGYCYGNSKWHDPECIVIGGKQRYEIKFGWFDTADSNGAKHLYLWFGRGLNANNEPLKLGYGGFSIINVHCGHSNVDVYTGWSATNTNPNNLTNVQKTLLPGYGNADYATSAGNADTVDNYHAAGLLTSASLGASGNSTTISVSVGGTTKTGSVTVPYATNADTVDDEHLSQFWKHGGAYPYGKSDKPWHKIATFTQSIASYQINTCLTLYISEFYSQQAYGILNIRARAEAGGATLGWLKLEWSLNVNIPVTNFIGTYKKSGNDIIINVYANRTGWASYSAVKIEEQAWGVNQDVWTLIHANNSSNSYASIPSDETQVTSVICTLNHNISGSADNADKLDTFHAADLFQTFTNDATNNAVKIKIGDNEKSLVVGYATKANTANSSEASEYLNNYTTTDPNTGAIKASKVKWFAYITSSSGYAGNNYGFKTTNNANGILYLGTHPGKYGHQLGFSSNGNIYHRYQNGADFPNTANGGSWEVLLTSNNYTTITDTRYVKKAGDTMTGLLTTTSAHSHDGIKVGDTYINAINGNLIFQNNSAIRFGGDSWDYNVWAGLKYVHSSKTIYLGLADGSSFTANSAQSGGKLYLPGIDNIYTGNGTNLIWHGGNDGSGSGLDADLLDGYHAADFRNNIIDLRSSPQTFNPTYLKDIVFISEADYSTLISNGSITKNSITHTYNASNWYVTDKVPPYAERAGEANYASDATHAYNADYATNAGSASQLQTQVSLWGQTFKGNNNVSGNMTSVGQVTPDGNATRSNGTSSANWASVYTRSIISGDNLTLTSGTSKDIIFKTNAGTEYMRLTSGGKLGLGRVPTASDARLTMPANSVAIDFRPDHSSYNARVEYMTAGNEALVFANKQSVTSFIFMNGLDLTDRSDYSALGTAALQIKSNGVAINRPIYGDNGMFYNDPGASGTKLVVGGLIKTISNGKYLVIGCKNGSWAHHETDAAAHYFSPSIHVNGDIWVYNTGWGIKSDGKIYGSGFYHSGNQSNDYVILGNGGTKQWSVSKVANTIVARTGDNYIYAGYYNSDISNEDSMTPGSVYFAQSGENWIRKQSIGTFADNLRADEIITITKTLTVTEAWMDTGIIMNTDTFPRSTGTYAIQIYSDTYSTDGYYPYYSGIMSIYTASTNGSLEDEVPLHCVGHANGGTVQDKRIYIRTVEQLNSNAKIQIAAASALSSHTYTFKFRKLI